MEESTCLVLLSRNLWKTYVRQHPRQSYLRSDFSFLGDMNLPNDRRKEPAAEVDRLSFSGRSSVGCSGHKSKPLAVTERSLLRIEVTSFRNSPSSTAAR